MKPFAYLLPALWIATQAGADDHLPVAPQYYLDTVIGMSLAEQYDWYCPEVEVDGDAMGAAYAVVLEQLAAAGIPTDAPHEHMLLPPVEETDGIIHAMLARHKGADHPEQSFCDGARAEMDEKSITGSFLNDVE